MVTQNKLDPLINILSVDDDKFNLLAIERLLGKLGLNIVSKNSGRKALEYLSSYSVAVILLDIRMPIMDGFETAELIRKNPTSRDTPIIFVTAEINYKENQIARANSLGAIDFILKDYLSDTLKTRVVMFADLYRQAQALKQQKDAREEEAKELRTALESLQLLVGWQDGTITAQMNGVGPLRQRSPDSFTVLQSEYGSLLDAYLKAMGYGQSPPRDKINSLADRIGSLGGGPRDVIDIHLRSVMHKCQDVHPMREKAYAIEGRLLALELMGYLVDFYRRPSVLHQSYSTKLQPKEKTK